MSLKKSLSTQVKKLLNKVAMKSNEGLPLVKFTMLVSSMAPLFLLVGIRGMETVVDDNHLQIAVTLLLTLPFIIIKLRIYFARKSNDVFVLDVSDSKNNKEYLFTYLFTVLLPLYSVSINDNREFGAVLFAICLVLFVLWNMNLHFVNILFAIQGYRVYTIESYESAILLTTRSSIPKDLHEIKVHRLSSSVFIELKKYNYAN